jgi:uncharacterized membrane protein AbrB (regulator of aidB expression)
MFFRNLCGFDRATAVFAAMPGGLGEMTLLGSQYGGDTRRLVLVHSVRIVAVVFAVPFIVSGMVPGGLTRSRARPCRHGRDACWTGRCCWAVPCSVAWPGAACGSWAE